MTFDHDPMLHAVLDHIDHDEGFLWDVYHPIQFTGYQVLAHELHAFACAGLLKTGYVVGCEAVNGMDIVIALLVTRARKLGLLPTVDAETLHSEDYYEADAGCVLHCMPVPTLPPEDLMAVKARVAYYVDAARRVEATAA